MTSSFRSLKLKNHFWLQISVLFEPSANHVLLLGASNLILSFPKKKEAPLCPVPSSTPSPAKPPGGLFGSETHRGKAQKTSKGALDRYIVYLLGMQRYVSTCLPS